MPLRALDTDDRELMAPLLEYAAWEALVSEVRAGRSVLRLPCCGAAARPRSGRHTIRHFFHHSRPEHCDYAGESREHLQLKAGIVRVLDDMGWAARTEVPGEGYRADVLAAQGDRQVVFEVQLSTQTGQVTLERTLRYRDAGLPCIWITKRVPILISAKETVYAFEVASYEPPRILVEGRPLSLTSFVEALVKRRLQLSAPTPAPRAIVRVHRKFVECQRPGCSTFTAVAGTSLETRCVCHQRPAPIGIGASVRAQLDEALQRAAADGALGAGQAQLVLARPDDVQGEPGTVEQSYRCPGCDGWSEVHIGGLWAPVAAQYEIELPADARLGVSSGSRHWCLREKDRRPER